MKNELPKFMDKNLLDVYAKWLKGKAAAHVCRDKRRGNKSAKPASYKQAIHQAVEKSEGKDCYTGEELSWDLISKWDNKKAKEGGREYKKQFRLLPTVDHVGDGKGADFCICAWEINDAKSDLTYKEFLDLCKRVIKRAQ